MLRYGSIVVFIIGMLLVILGATKILAGVTSAGVSLLFLGALLFGLSFIPRPDSDSTVDAMSPLERLTKIFYAPTEVFQNLRRHPRWFIALLLMALASVVYYNAFLYRLTPERVVNYAVDKTLEMPMLNDEARAEIEKNRAKSIADAKNPVLIAGSAVGTFTGQVFLYTFLGVILFLFALAMGGKMNFWQALTASVYASFPVVIITKLLSLVILFIKDPIDIHPIIGQGSLVQDSLNFLVTPADNPVLFVLLGFFGLLNFYWLWLLATGMKNTGERVTPTTAWTTAIVIWACWLLLSVTLTLLFPSFIS